MFYTRSSSFLNLIRLRDLTDCSSIFLISSNQSNSYFNCSFFYFKFSSYFFFCFTPSSSSIRLNLIPPLVSMENSYIFIKLYLMGSIFNKKPLKEPNQELIEYLKSKKMEEINDVVEVLDGFYQLQQSLNYEQFQDAFLVYLDNFTEQFFIQLESSHSIEGVVDIYESLAVTTIFSTAHYEEKLKFIFALFDFDKSQNLAKTELQMVYQTGVRALCKMVNIQLPTFKELEAFALSTFTFVDKDNNKIISDLEFTDFMNNQPDLQDFLLKYAQIQTNSNALRRFNEIQKKYAECYLQQEIFMNVQDLKPRLAKNINGEDLDFLLKIMMGTSQYLDKNLPDSLIMKAAYNDVIRAWCAFEATDINNDNQLNLKELAFLLFTYEGEEPSIFRLNEDMEQLDKDHSRTISKQEWMNFLCVSKESQGKGVLRSSLKQKFKQYDVDNSGYLDKNEMRNILLETFKDVEGRFTSRSKEEYEEYRGMIYSLCDQILEGMNKNPKEDNEVNWLEFKDYLEVGMGKIEQLKDFIRKL